jgi:hypothetical protein
MLKARANALPSFREFIIAGYRIQRWPAAPFRSALASCPSRESPPSPHRAIVTLTTAGPDSGGHVSHRAAKRRRARRPASLNLQLRGSNVSTETLAASPTDETGGSSSSMDYAYAPCGYGRRSGGHSARFWRCVRTLGSFEPTAPDPGSQRLFVAPTRAGLTLFDSRSVCCYQPSRPLSGTCGLQRQERVQL